MLLCRCRWPAMSEGPSSRPCWAITSMILIARSRTCTRYRDWTVGLRSPEGIARLIATFSGRSGPDRSTSTTRDTRFGHAQHYTPRAGRLLTAARRPGSPSRASQRVARLARWDAVDAGVKMLPTQISLDRKPCAGGSPSLSDLGVRTSLGARTQIAVSRRAA